MGEKKMMKKLYDEPSGDPQTSDVLTPEYEVWKPDRLNPTLSTLNDNEKRTFYLFRSVTSITNKLTPENFNKLVEKMKNLTIDTTTRMQGVVEIIHKKAINEWKFCGLYAELCDQMKDVAVVDEKENTTSFPLSLIAHCEEYFKNSLVKDFKFDRRKASINLCLNLEKKKKLLEDYELDEYMFRKQNVGNCRFIGELFKLYLINPKIVFFILDKLFKHEGIMSIECSCALISTIGSFYEDKFEKFPELYFEKIDKLVQHEELPSRIRFMLQDILDLKKNSWRCRFQPEVPKTFAQIEREIQEEKMQMALALEIWSSKARVKSKEKYYQTNSTSWTKLSCQLETNASVKKPYKKKIASIENATSQENIASDGSSNGQTSKTVSKRWLKSEELLEACKRVFDDYVQHSAIQSTVNSFRKQFVKNQIPKVICALIQYVLENDLQNAGKCGEMLVGFMEQEVITPRQIVKGISTLLKTCEEQHIPADLERILGPLFLGNYLQLEDLSVIFEDNRNTKTVSQISTKKTKQEKCEGTTISAKEEADNDCVRAEARHDENYSQQEITTDIIAGETNESKVETLPVENYKSPLVNETISLLSTNDPTFVSTYLNIWNLSNDELRALFPAATESFISDERLLMILDLCDYLTPETYEKNVSKLTNFAFASVIELEIAATYLIYKVYEYPDGCQSYAKMFSNMEFSTLKGKNFRTCLINACQKEFEYMTAKEEKSDLNHEKCNSADEGESTTKKLPETWHLLGTSLRHNMIALCRLIPELIKIDFMTKKIFTRCLLKLSTLKNLEYFCEMFRSAKGIDLPSEFKLKLKLCIRELLARNDVPASIQLKLKDILHNTHLSERDKSLSKAENHVVNESMQQRPLSNLEIPQNGTISSLITYAEYAKLKEEVEKLRQLEEENRKQLQVQGEQLAQLNELIDDIKGLKK